MSAAQTQRRSYRVSLYLLLACMLGGAGMSLWQLWQASRNLSAAEALKVAAHYQALLAAEHSISARTPGAGAVEPAPPLLNGDWSTPRLATTPAGRSLEVRLYRKGVLAGPTQAGLGDEFEREALRQLRERPSQPFAQIAQRNGERVLRYATVRASHPAAAASQGEVLELIMPLASGLRPSLKQLGAMVLPLAVGTLLGFVVVGRAVQRQGKALVQPQGAEKQLAQDNLRLAGENNGLKSAERALRMGGAALKLSAAKTRGIVNTAVDGIIVIDERGIVELFNPAASAIFGYAAEDVVGHDISMLMPPGEAGRGNHITDYIRTGRGQVIGKVLEITGSRKGGAGFPIDVALSEMQLGSQRLFTAFVRDITERKAAAEELARARDAALESARLKSEFLANVSHEIRTPLNGVIGITGLLLDMQLNSEQLAHVETVRSSADALLAIVNDILDFSKIEAGELNIRHTDFDVVELIDGLTDLFAESAAAKGIALGSVVHHAAPRKLKGDPGRLRQVLINLMGNAVKFTERGHVLLRVVMDCGEASRAVLRFAVTDTGPGIPKPAQARLFTAFYQVDGSLTRIHGGTGLGLAISKKLVERMGGSIGLRSEPGTGSTFWFTCELERQEATAPETPAFPGGPALRVLIVESPSLCRAVLNYHLTAWGMEVDRAANVEAARSQAALVASADEGRYDLLFLDAAVPGAERVQEVGQLLPELHRAPPRLVLLHQRDNKAARGGWRPNAYLAKPIKEQQLINAIRAAFGEGDISLPEPVVSAPAPDRAVPDGVQVLLVEDNVINQKVAIGQLKKLGYASDVAANGREALEALRDKHYDVVLMDCQMPEMDGYEATRRLREGEAGGGPRLPVVALTAHALDGEREKCMAAGMDDFLTKPVKLDSLRETLERWCRSAVTQDAALTGTAAAPSQESA